MNNGRKYFRRRTSDYLQVFDRETRKILGRILNMSPKGIMVMSAEPLDVGRSYQFNVKLPVEMSDKGPLELVAKARWNKFEKRSELWENGFEIEEISEDSRKLLKQVMLLLVAQDTKNSESDEAKNDRSHEKIESVRALRYR